MNKFLSDIGAALEWIWMTPEAARRLLHVDGQVASPTRGITFEVGTERLAA